MDDKFCTRCGLTLPLDQFSVTSCRGKPLRRSWCNSCEAAYHASDSSKIAAKVRVIRRLCRQLRTNPVFCVRREPTAWHVVAIIDEGRERLVSKHATEQQAELTALGVMAIT